MKNLKELKTTILGIIVILSALAYVFVVEDANYVILVILLIFGVGLGFMKDKFLGSLGGFLDANKDKKI